MQNQIWVVSISQSSGADTFYMIDAVGRDVVEMQGWGWEGVVVAVDSVHSYYTGLFQV